MIAALKLGPRHHGQPLSLEEFENADYRGGFKYELIEGRLYVSPQPNLPEDIVEEWLLDKVKGYAKAHPEVLNYVTAKARVFAPGRKGTMPEPDLAAYHDFPRDVPLRELRWQDVSPVLVGEVVSSDDPDKDLVRNVKLYLRVASIKEYWIVDAREDPARPTLIVHRRHGKGWRKATFGPGTTFVSRLLPGFELLIDPSR